MRAEDPDLDRRLREASSRNVLLGKSFKDDQDHQRRSQEKAMTVRRALLSDPESSYRETLSDNGRRTGPTNAKKMNATRRTCDTCGLETNAGNLGRHQIRSGHSGYRKD